jgi:ribosome-associated protein
MLFQTTDNVVPVKKTSSSKIQDRNKADVNPPTAATTKAAGNSKAGNSKAGKPKAGKPKAADKPRAAGKPKPADNRKATKAGPSLQAVVVDALADMKALEVKVLDVRGLTDIADFMVIASGTSDRHVRSVAQRVVEKTKEAGFRPHGVEGQQDSDWVLIDLSEMIVHVMLPRVREFYGLEKLWDITATKRAARA